MRAMKGLVIGLGALIVLSFVLLFYGFITNIAGTEEEPASAVAVAPPPPQPGFGTARLVLPAGCNVVDMRPDGSRLYLRTGPVGLCERIIVIDTGTGTELGTIQITP